MRKLLIATLSVAIFSLAACAAPGGGPSYKKLKAQAQAEMAKAKKMNALWRDTGKILKKADAARANGDNPKAYKLVKKAIKQAQLAQAQAKGQVNAGPRYPK